jgi:hypothetical protein
MLILCFTYSTVVAYVENMKSPTVFVVRTKPRRISNVPVEGSMTILDTVVERSKSKGDG